jgi:quinol monooxygenase YgiN
MARILIQHHVKDFAEWKKAFDSAADLRTRNGGLSTQVYQNESDPNSITAILKWDSMMNAHKYTQSPELKAAMEKAGVVGQPSISFLNEV